MEEHWTDDDFGVLKVDMKPGNYAEHFPKCLPWVSWCCGQYPILWHSMRCLSSASGVQQGDPLGPLIFLIHLKHLDSLMTASVLTSYSYIVK